MRLVKNLQSDFKESLLALLDKYRELGEVVLPNGTMSIGKIPGKEKWFLVHLYAGLSSNEIQQMEDAIGRRFPEGLRNFYRQFNGMTLFGAGQLEIWGTIGPAPKGMPNYQPISLVNAQDTRFELRNALSDAIFFGGYFGHYFFTTVSSNTVFACTDTDATPIEQWDDVESMILDATKRLSVWFDENAQPVDPAVNERPMLFEKRVRSQPTPQHD